MATKVIDLTGLKRYTTKLTTKFDGLYCKKVHAHSDATKTASGFMSANDKVKLDNLMLTMNPVGTVVINTTGTNPSSYIGGTWVQYAQGRVLIGVGTGNDGDIKKTFSSNATGGKYQIWQTEIQSPWKRSSSESSANFGLSSGGAFGKRVAVSIGGEGNINTAVNPMDITQPYQTVYMWRRTA